MSRRAITIIGGAGLAGVSLAIVAVPTLIRTEGAGYYLYQAGGDTGAAQKQLERTKFINAMDDAT